MSGLLLALLGRPNILVDGQQIELKSQKAQALFFYLVMSRLRHSRQSLAGLLWGDLDEAAARRNLRVELLKLRKVLDAYLDVERDTLALDRTSDYQLDVERFEECLHGHEASFAELQEAVALYHGEFLEDFHIREAPLYEEWVTSERERLSQMARQATLRLIEHYIQLAEYDRGLERVNQLLIREPWLEEAHQQKMRLLACNGQRTAALAHYEVASRLLDEEFGVPPSDETNALYDQIESGEFESEHSPLAPRTPTLATLPSFPSAPPFQAPAAQLHFVGRHTELDALTQQLATATHERVTALVGMGGIGKTALMAQVAHTVREHFVDGVLWAYTAESEPLDILGSWAQTLGYDFSSLSDVENRAAAMRGVLADKQVLILLDDVRSVARVRPLFVAGGTGNILLTTRDADVATALNALIYPLAEMTPEDGEQLLQRILGEERMRSELEAAREICNLLQNLPLAVEIAAQRLRSRPRRKLADMAARLQDTQGRLELAISDRAVRTSFLVSWQSLDAELQRVFALLGLWEGRSFAAPALAHLAELDLYTAEDRLFALTALSLLNEEENTSELNLRYRQHPLMADFALEQMADDQTVLLRLVHYYLAFAKAERTNYPALRPEWENLMIGLRKAHQLAEWQVVLDYAETLTEPWFTRARYTEARASYALAKEAAEQLNERKALSDCLLRWGQACVEQNAAQEAKQLLERVIALSTEVHHSQDLADAQYHLARLYIEQGYYDDANFLLHASLQYCEEQNDIAGIAAIYYQQAIIKYRQDELSESESLCTRALAIYESTTNEIGLIQVFRFLADLYLEQQEYVQAERYCQEALTLCQKLQNRSELMATYYSLTVVTRLLGKWELARDYGAQVIELSEVIGNMQFRALALYELSKIDYDHGSFTSALALGQKSLLLMQTLQDNFNQVYVLRHLGNVHEKLDQSEVAMDLWQNGFMIASEQRHPLTTYLKQKIEPLLLQVAYDNE